MKKYDFLIVGSGLFGSVCAFELKKRGFSVLVIDKRNHIGGNIYTEVIDDIIIHRYGAHIFHTSNDYIWQYINQFASFNNFVNSPIANYHGELYHLPFNMNTFVELWPDVVTPQDAENHIKGEIEETNILKVTNLEQQAIKLVGKTIFTKLIKEYTEKQWGKPCSELPASIIQRIPVRYTFDNNYFNDKYQGIPIGGYTQIILKMLNGIEVKLNCDFLKKKPFYYNLANRIIYTGSIDEFFNYCFGKLEYRSLFFKIKKLKCDSFQNNAVVNYTSHDVPYTRIIEHKFFDFKNQKTTIISEEFPQEWTDGKERYYTINDEKNSNLYNKYLSLAQNEKKVFFGGRLGMYKYFDMDDTIEHALKLVEEITK